MMTRLPKALRAYELPQAHSQLLWFPGVQKCVDSNPGAPVIMQSPRLPEYAPYQVIL